MLHVLEAERWRKSPSPNAQRSDFDGSVRFRQPVLWIAESGLVFCPTPPPPPAPSILLPDCVPAVVPGTVTRGAVEAGCSLLSLGQLSSQRPGHACQGGQRQPSPVESQALGPGEARCRGSGRLKTKK